MSEPLRCRRCEFLDDERVPIGEDGLCLWCRMALTGVDTHEFYTSGAWMGEIEWRGDETRGNALRQRIRERMAECGDTTIRSVALQCDVSETTLGNYMSKRNRREDYMSAKIVAAMVDYLVLPIEQVMELAGHPKLYVYRGNWGRRTKS